MVVDSVRGIIVESRKQPISERELVLQDVLN